MRLFQFSSLFQNVYFFKKSCTFSRSYYLAVKYVTNFFLPKKLFIIFVFLNQQILKKKYTHHEFWTIR